MKIRKEIKRLRKQVRGAEGAAKRIGLPDFTAHHARRKIRALRHLRRRLNHGETCVLL